MTNELYHHGIKGQRWGVRRTPEQLGYKTTTKMKKALSTAASSVSKYAKGKVSKAWSVHKLNKLMRKNPNKLTPEELKTVTERNRALDENSRLKSQIESRKPKKEESFLSKLSKSAISQATSAAISNAMNMKYKEAQYQFDQSHSKGDNLDEAIKKANLDLKYETLKQMRKKNGDND